MTKISNWNSQDFTKFLYSHNLTQSSDLVRDISKAGEGNMNCTLRVKTDKESFIFKQSPPYCEKFPDIPAPEERILAEAKFYDLANRNPKIRKYFPEIFYLDQGNKILVMQDLGKATDFEWIYEQKKIEPFDLRNLIYFLSELHSTNTNSQKFPNTEMRKLNYDYIFKLPFVDQSTYMDLDSVTKGLKDLGLQYSKDFALADSAKALGEVYLNDGDVLVHGDFYPRSWIKASEELYVIDPEFGFLGSKEFELGVFFAHLSLADQIGHTLKEFDKHYLPRFEQELVAGFTGVEIIRRLLCVAQVPVTNSIETKKRWLEIARELVVTKNYELISEL